MTEPVSSQPSASISPVTMSTEGSWTTGRFDCFADLPICCLGCFCPVILSFYLVREFRENYCLAVVPGGITALRTHLRHAYGIPGTVSEDAVAVFFCGLCEQCRMAREVHAHSMGS